MIKYVSFEIPVGIRIQGLRKQLGVPLWNLGKKKGLEKSVWKPQHFCGN